jgi:site-specific DNA-methyltransferase (adenine-specific)
LNVAYLMDCMEYMKTLPDKHFELAIVDPPYGLKAAGMQSGGTKGIFESRAFKRKELELWDIAPKQDYFDELFRVSKNQIIWGGNYFPLPTNRCFVIWDKVQPWETFSMCEYAWTSFTSPAKLFKFDNRTSGKIHPTQKPVALYEWLLTHYAKQGDKILDTHLGSGSSRIAAYNLGFDFVGCEIDEDYFKAQEERFAAHTAQTSLFDGEGL